MKTRARVNLCPCQKQSQTAFHMKQQHGNNFMPTRWGRSFAYPVSLAKGDPQCARVLCHTSLVCIQPRKLWHTGCLCVWEKETPLGLKSKPRASGSFSGDRISAWPAEPETFQLSTHIHPLPPFSPLILSVSLSPRMFFISSRSTAGSWTQTVITL